MDDRPPRAEPRSKEMVAAKHTLGGDPDIVLLSFFDGLGTSAMSTAKDRVFDGKVHLGR